MDERWNRVYRQEVSIYDAFSAAEDEDERVLTTLLDNFSFQDRIVLDAGCGSGRYAKMLAPRCRRFIGVDLSAPLLHYARRQGRQGANVDFIQARFEEIPLPDHCVDLVFSTFAVDLLAFEGRRHDPTAEMSRVTRVGGDICLVVNHWQGQFMEMRGEQEQESTRRGLHLLQQRGFALFTTIETTLHFDGWQQARQIMGFIFGQKAVNYLQRQPEPRMGRVVALLHKKATEGP